VHCNAIDYNTIDFFSVIDNNTIDLSFKTICTNYNAYYNPSAINYKQSLFIIRQI